MVEYSTITSSAVSVILKLFVAILRVMRVEILTLTVEAIYFSPNASLMHHPHLLYHPLPAIFS
jgi:hypothetical protein